MRGASVLGVDSANESVVDSPTIDAEGLLISPGLIDLQINGGHGLDLATEPESMWELANRLVAYGVTAFCPTIVTGPTEINHRAIAALANRPADHLGAEPLGLHFEGPMLNGDYKGAHRDAYLRAPSLEDVERWSSRQGVALVTLAPELPGAQKVIEHLRSQGVVVAAGHSAASAVEAKQAMDAGITMVTHLFNAMAPIHHRDPRLAGFAMANRGLTAGLIVDGIHVDPVMVAAAWAAKGMTGLVLVSDAVAAMGMPPGTHEFGSVPVIADDEGVRYEDGTLAGSALTLDAAARNLMDYSGCWVEEALCTVTATPASVLDLPDRGVIAPGAVADFALFDDEMNVAMTICRGRPVYVADGHHDRLPPELSESPAVS